MFLVSGVHLAEHITNGFQLERCHIAQPSKRQGYGGLHWLTFNYSSHVTQHSISIWEVDTSKSDIFFLYEKNKKIENLKVLSHISFFILV